MDKDLTISDYTFEVMINVNVLYVDKQDTAQRCARSFQDIGR